MRKRKGVPKNNRNARNAKNPLWQLKCWCATTRGSLIQGALLAHPLTSNPSHVCHPRQANLAISALAFSQTGGRHSLVSFATKKTGTQRNITHITLSLRVEVDQMLKRENVQNWGHDQSGPNPENGSLKER